MGNLEKLKQLVADMFDKAENKSDVEALSAIKQACDEVEVEQNKLQAEKKELLDDYKELVCHTSFKDNRTFDPTNANDVDIDVALKNAIEKLK